MIFISEKCKELRISFVKNEPQFARIVIDGKELERVTSAKLLGMTISSNLTWNEHISDVSRKRQIVLGTVLLLDPASIIYIRRFLVLLSYFLYFYIYCT